MKKPKREVSYDGDTFKVKSNKIEIPNFAQMERFAVLIWLNKHTYPRGYGRKPANPLQGICGAIKFQ